MGLTYHFKFAAPASKTAAELELFLRELEHAAQKMGFFPTTVLNVSFDTGARKEFAKRLTKGLIVEDEWLKGQMISTGDEIWDFNSREGWCRVAPIQAVLLVATDEEGREAFFGFFRYPKSIIDDTGRQLVATTGGDAWIFEDSIKTPDPRYRALVKHFADAGFLKVEQDDFV